MGPPNTVHERTPLSLMSLRSRGRTQKFIQSEGEEHSRERVGARQQVVVPSANSCQSTDDFCPGEVNNHSLDQP